MLDFIQADNFEYTRFVTEAFQFNCFYIQDSNTLPHWHNHTEIVCISKGNCHIYIDGNLFICQMGDFLLVPPGYLHSILPQASSDYYAIVIGETLMSIVSKDIHLNPLISPFINKWGISPLYVSNLHPAYDRCWIHLKPLITFIPTQTPFYEARIKLEICQLILQLNLNFPEHMTQPSIPTTFNTKLLKKAIEYLQTHYHEKITIHNLAKTYGLSEQHFSRLFKAYTGKTIVDYLTLFRLECANKLLVTTDLPITQIPEVTGFCNANYFSRVYKNQFGQTPSDTRKAHVLKNNPPTTYTYMN